MLKVAAALQAPPSKALQACAQDFPTSLRTQPFVVGETLILAYVVANRHEMARMQRRVCLAWNMVCDERCCVVS